MFIHWRIQGLKESIWELFDLMFLAKFQLILEKLDLFKTHQYILTSMFFPVCVSWSVAAAVRPYVLYQWGTEVPEHYAYNKKVNPIFCSEGHSFYWSLQHYVKGWIMHLCQLQHQDKVNALFPRSLFTLPTTTQQSDLDPAFFLIII